MPAVIAAPAPADPSLAETLGFAEAAIDPNHGRIVFDRQPLESSYLASVGYDADEMMLEVEFADSSVYRYAAVPEKVYEELLESASPGRYFLNQVRERFPYEAVHLADYRETAEYVTFVREKLNMVYIDNEKDLAKAIKQILALDTPLSIDFEAAIDSYSDKSKGCLRLIQIGVDEPSRGIAPKQWLIDCFRVDPSSVMSVFGSKQEKLIHFLFFEQTWTTERFGKPIKNIFDSCIAWRGIQSYLASGIRAADSALLGGNIPRSLRRTLGVTMMAELTDPVSGKTQLVELDASKEVSEEENFRVYTEILPELVRSLTVAGYEPQRLSPAQVGQLLTPELGVTLAGKATAAEAWQLAKLACQERNPKLHTIPSGEDVDPLEIVELKAENTLLRERAARIPYLLALANANGRPQFYAVEEFDPSKRANTAFHPNTLAYLAKRTLGFELPKTEQAGYWGREELTATQKIYAAVDVATLPKICAHTKEIVAKLGIEEQVYEQRIGAAEERVAERVQAKLAEGDYTDHFALAQGALNRAQSLAELERSWHSLRQMALVAPSYTKLRHLYTTRKRSLETGIKPRQRVAAGATPF